MADINDSMLSTLKSSDLSDVAMDLGEVGVDAFLAEGAFRDIPIIGTLAGLWKTGVTVRDFIFVRKLAKFITALRDVPQQKRDEMIARLESDAKRG